MQNEVEPAEDENKRTKGVEQDGVLSFYKFFCSVYSLRDILMERTDTR